MQFLLDSPPWRSETMTMNTTIHWLDDLGLSQYASVFTENAIDLEVLPQLTEADLESLGVLLGHRKKILKVIADQSPGAGEASARPEEAKIARAQEPSPTPVKAERRQLTVMFCDLVGSTELSHRLDPEDLREVISRYRDAVAGAVARYEGHVARFVGDGALVYFGWPRAYEDQAERAVRAGLAAVRAVANLKLDDGTALQARVGIATGQVVIGDLVGEVAAEAEAVAGATPNLAARLQGVAEPSQVVIGSTTRLLVGNAFELKDLGGQQLKGFAGPVPAWCVSGESAVETRFEAVHPDTPTPFIDRQHELGLLRHAWELSQAGFGHGFHF